MVYRRWPVPNDFAQNMNQCMKSCDRMIEHLKCGFGMPLAQFRGAKDAAKFKEFIPQFGGSMNSFPV
jgi:hypothetical protein